MSEHSTKELQRQRDDAYSRHNQTRLDLAAAEKRLHDALCRDSGLMGKVATRVGGGASILIHDVEFSSGRPWRVRGFAFKKDGTIGFSERYFYTDSITVREVAA